MTQENKQAKSIDLLYSALGMINNIPEERYSYIPELIEGATSAILHAVDIIANDLAEKE